MSRSFLQEESIDTCIMIVDAMNLAFRYKHSKNFQFLEDFHRTVDSLKRSYKATHVVIACDKGSSKYRKALFPEYKLARKLKYENQTEQEEEEMKLFFKELDSVMERFIEENKYLVLRYDGCEADDIAAYIVSNTKDRIWLISSDKDWDLLINDRVSRFSYVTRKEITSENWHEHYDYSQEDHISIKCLTGDSGDSIPGIPSVGPVTARKLIQEYGTAFDVAEAIPIAGSKAYIKKVNDFGKEGILLNYSLMDLLSTCQEALGKENCDDILIKLNNYLESS